VTTPAERTRALLEAGSFLIQIARSKDLPLEVRQRAVAIARHFPCAEDVAALANPDHQLSPKLETLNLHEVSAGRYLTHATRLSWPTDDPLIADVSDFPALAAKKHELEQLLADVKEGAVCATDAIDRAVADIDASEARIDATEEGAPGRSRILHAVVEAARDLHALGFIDDVAMRRYEALCDE
jgi:hypothetical protein